MNILKKSVLSLVLILLGLASKAQQDSSVKKYPSLLWEITGNGMEKPSYLFGTMHVSAKMAFYLSDSFFSALRSVDVVGLESRPDEWLPNLVAMGLLNPYSIGQGYNYTRTPSSFTDPTFQLSKGSMEEVKMAIAQDNQLINALLYRTNAGMQDFQERTYLDLFIFQTGMKLNKELLSLEDYATSLTLVTKAGIEPGGYSEDSDDFEPKTKENNRYYRGYSNNWELIEDAYRRGDLDILDSLDITTSSPHERKYMLLDRNENIVQRADSVMKARSLFIAVGAAHLPGEGGVIELLRSLGYTVRPVMQKGRDEKSRKKYDEILVSHPIKSFVSSDSMFRADFPGIATELPYINGSGVILFPDMVNGSYYIVTRTTYHRALWNESPEYVLERIDSFLYEYVPGDIISKDKIMVSGYPGFDIMNKTRSGDYQRSRIMVLPDEIILIKLAGKGKHARSKQVSGFFNSIKLQPHASVWQQIPVENAHLSFEFPGKPSRNFILNKQEGTQERKEFILSGSEKENV
ncbi:MAG: TraB/GumN family protein, partial [Bacteroidia bacterium]